MTEQVENLILEHLKAMRADIAEIRRDLAELKERMTRLERHVADALKRLAHVEGDVLGQNARFDRLEARISRIERRLELAP